MTHRTSLLFYCAVSFGAMLALTACVASEADDLCSDLPMPERASSPDCVPPDAGVPSPTVAFPSWSKDHNQTQTVAVVPPPGWAIDLAEYNVDDGAWQQASSTDGTNYTVTLADLDIGNNAFALRVTSSYRGVSEVDSYYSTFTVDPVVQCDAKAMLPGAQLNHNNGTDVRTLLGYFGEPKEHSVTVVVSFTDQLSTDNQYKNVGVVTSQSRDSVTAEFDVGAARCETDWPQRPGGPAPHDCDVPYGITVTVDGNSAWTCTNANFGQIHTYWDR